MMRAALLLEGAARRLTSPLGAARRLYGTGITYAELSRPRASREVWSPTLPVALPLHVRSRRHGPAAPRAPSTGSAPTPPLSEPEAPSTYESLLASIHAGAGIAAERAATGTSTLPPRPSFRHAFTRKALRARLDHLAGYSPELTSHVPPVDFCSLTEPRARPRIIQTPPFSRWQATAGGWYLPCGPYQPGCHSSGVPDFLSKAR